MAPKSNRVGNSGKQKLTLNGKKSPVEAVSERLPWPVGGEGEILFLLL